MNKEIDTEILEKNRLFAKFMGGKPVGNGFEFSTPPTTISSSRLFHIEDIAYHSSWDWLIPLWKKMCEKRKLNEDFQAIEELVPAICDNNIQEAWRILSQRMVKKVCPNKIDGSCPLHNIHCAYPKCEEDEE